MYIERYFISFFFSVKENQSIPLMAFYQANLIRKSLSAFERDRKPDSNVMPYAHVFSSWYVNWSLACINDKDSFTSYCLLIIIVIVISFHYAITASPGIQLQYVRDNLHCGDMIISFRVLKYLFPGVWDCCYLLCCQLIKIEIGYTWNFKCSTWTACNSYLITPCVTPNAYSLLGSSLRKSTGKIQHFRYLLL